MNNSLYLCNNNEPEPPPPADEPPPPTDEAEPIEHDWHKKSEDDPLEIR